MKNITIRDITTSYDERHPDRIDLGDGYYAIVECPYDEDHGAPWDEIDGHGPVSDWTSRHKAPGEWVLCSDRHSKRYYDHAEAMRIAKRDGWGIADEEKAEIEACLGRNMTKGEIAAASVQKDFDYLYGWCDNQWHWIGVSVQIYHDGLELFEDSRWGIEDSTDCWKIVALDMIEEGIGRIEKENQEADYWAARDTITAT